MAVNKEHKKFHAIDMSSGWETLPGYPAGIQQKILSGALDEKNKRGSRSRLLRFEPGHLNNKPVVARIWGRGLSGLGRSHGRQRRRGQRRRVLQAQHLCLAAARRLAWAVQIRER